MILVQLAASPSETSPGGISSIVTMPFRIASGDADNSMSGPNLYFRRRNLPPISLMSRTTALSVGNFLASRNLLNGSRNSGGRYVSPNCCEVNVGTDLP